MANTVDSLMTAATDAMLLGDYATALKNAEAAQVLASGKGKSMISGPAVNTSLEWDAEAIEKAIQTILRRRSEANHAGGVPFSFANVEYKRADSVEDC